MTEFACAAPDPKPFRRKLWRWFGFRYAFVPMPETVEGYVESALTTVTTTHVDWRDRFRILVSGKVMLMTKTQTDVEVIRARSTSDFAVLPPGAE